jgi:hypothetical protein
MMRRARELGTPADWLMRAKHNRCVPEADGDKLWDYTTAEQALGEITFTVSSREKQTARTVRQQLWARAVELSDGSKEGRIAATCVVARELDPPKGAKPIEWRLLTNRQVTSATEATELIDWYRARWEVDIYQPYNLLKSH